MVCADHWLILFEDNAKPQVGPAWGFCFIRCNKQIPWRPSAPGDLFVNAMGFIARCWRSGFRGIPTPSPVVRGHGEAAWQKCMPNKDKSGCPSELDQLDLSSNRIGV